MICGLVAGISTLSQSRSINYGDREWCAITYTGDCIAMLWYVWMLMKYNTGGGSTYIVDVGGGGSN